MKQQSTLYSWSRTVIGKSVGLLSLCFALTTAAYAQDAATLNVPKPGSVTRQLQKRAHHSKHPLPQLPMASELVRRVAHDASGQPLNFPERVWFPGEWEEVKAVCVSPMYYHFVPGYEEDEHYGATPIVEGYASYIYQENKLSEQINKGYGPYITQLDVTSQYGTPFLYLMDGIQQSGAEAWVRIESANDEQTIRKALENKGLRTDKLRFFLGGGNAFWFRDCGPICFYYGDDDKVAMLDFFYGAERSLDDLLPSMLHRQMGIPNYITSVIWEGGNCLVDGAGGLVTSSAVYRNNTGTTGPIIWDGKNYSTISYSKKDSLDKNQVDAALSGMLGQASYCVLTHLGHDGGTGHIDLYADATDENGFLFAQMPEQYKSWGDYGVVNKNIGKKVILN